MCGVLFVVDVLFMDLHRLPTIQLRAEHADGVQLHAGPGWYALRLHGLVVSAASGPTEDLQQMRRRGAIERSVVCERFFAALIVRSWVQ